MEAQFGNFLTQREEVLYSSLENTKKTSQSDLDEHSPPVFVVSSSVLTSSNVPLPQDVTSSSVPLTVMRSSLAIPSTVMPSVVGTSVIKSSPALMTRISSTAVPSAVDTTSTVPIIVMASSSVDMSTSSLDETAPVITEILPHSHEGHQEVGEMEEHLVEVHDQTLNNDDGKRIVGNTNINIEHRVVINEKGEVILLKTNEEVTPDIERFDNAPTTVDEIHRQGQRTEHLMSELEYRLISGQETIL